MMAVGEVYGPPLNLDLYLSRRIKNRIYRVGVELEGGWRACPENVHPVRDGSVFKDVKVADPSIQYCGEIPLPPLIPDKLPGVMAIYYPHYVDATCGMHVHMSTKRAFTYQRLMINQPYSYPATVIKYLTRWATLMKIPADHPIWPRLLGMCEYCQHLFYADEQVKTVSKDYDHHRFGNRYTAIGYPWGRLSTVECRVLPMLTTVNMAIMAIEELLRITNAFLVASHEREDRLTTTIEYDNDDCPMERTRYV